MANEKVTRKLPARENAETKSQMPEVYGPQVEDVKTRVPWVKKKQPPRCINGEQTLDAGMVAVEGEELKKYAALQAPPASAEQSEPRKGRESGVHSVLALQLFGTLPAHPAPWQMATGFPAGAAARIVPRRHGGLGAPTTASPPSSAIAPGDRGAPSAFTHGTYKPQDATVGAAT